MYQNNMSNTFFSHNGQILPVSEATIPLSSIEYSYGYGVYETIRAVGETLRFLDQHCARLMESAAIIGLEHRFTEDFVAKSAEALVARNQLAACNVKIMLIGGDTAEDAQLYVQCLSPFFPDRKLYRVGAHAITVKYERLYPHAKSLNMLPSYLAYRKAKSIGAYDALLVSRSNNITEGTRTNFYTLQGNTIISPPESQILLGVTRHNVLQVARSNGFEIIEQDIPLTTVGRYDAAFITSTSTGIMPLHSIDAITWDDGVAPALKGLMIAYNTFQKET